MEEADEQQNDNGPTLEMRVYIRLNTSNERYFDRIHWPLLVARWSAKTNNRVLENFDGITRQPQIKIPRGEKTKISKAPVPNCGGTPTVVSPNMTSLKDPRTESGSFPGENTQQGRRRWPAR